MASTLLDRLWSAHEIARRGDGASLLFIDRHILHELTSPRAFDGLRNNGRKVLHPELTVAVVDHIVATLPGRTAATFPEAVPYVEAMRRNADEFGIALYDIGNPNQGIVHVVAPELGIALPGVTLVCGDSHTCTVGAFGALAFGIGTSEIEHTLATQSIWLKKPKSFRISVEGRLGYGVAAKDLALAIIARFGTAAGNGFAVEYDGEAISRLEMEGRMTLCSMGVEFGARIAMIAPDEKTLAYVEERPFAPKGAALDAARKAWSELKSDPGARFDRDETLDAALVPPQISWGTSPQQTVAVDAAVPAPGGSGDERALSYMGLQAGQKLDGLPIQKVFIGSCTNGRLSDLKIAAEIVKGRKVREGVQAIVVPGSTQVKLGAEAEGLDRIFRDAGFEWRESGCSMCAAVNGDGVGAGERCVSTGNRNFEGRQGPGSRTHLASPGMAAAAAIAGRIVDVRRLERSA